MSEKDPIILKNKLTQEQIEALLLERAKEVHEKVRRLEKSSLVTQKTMHLQFDPPGHCGGNH